MVASSMYASYVADSARESFLAAGQNAGPPAPGEAFNGGNAGANLRPQRLRGKAGTGSASAPVST